jgi:hypothetical protein
MNEDNTSDLSKKRQHSDYFKLSRSQLFNHFDTENKKSRPEHKILDFVTKRFWTWIYYYLTSRFQPNHAYPAYVAPETGVYPLQKAVDSRADYISIAIVADWATDTTESIQIANKMASHNPEYTIHMGDTYYVGAPHEINNNFIKPGSAWPRGSVGSFALLGNHEMYARGTSFFDDLLKTLGVKNVDGKYGGQRAGFFCLENDHWRILGLDTGYHSTGRLPILELIFQPDCHFDKILMKWLEEVVRAGDPLSKKGILILTHHQYITAFQSEREYNKPAVQFASLIGNEKPVIWLWGHEHKFSAFEKVRIEEGVTAYGRCIGHGGMPVELTSSSFKKSNSAKGLSKLVMVDTRKRPGTEDYPLGFNGYALIKIREAKLSIEYHDVNERLLTETWTVNGQGHITGAVYPEPSFAKCLEDGKNWNQMVT